MLTASRLAASVAAWGLEDSQFPLDLSGIDWTALAAVIGANRLEGLLAAAIDAGDVKVTAEQAAAAYGAAEAAAVAAVRLERRLLLAAAVLDDHNIRWRLLKGCALAHTDYPSPELRGSGDVDLLVDTAGWDRAVEAMRAAEFRRTLPE